MGPYLLQWALKYGSLFRMWLKIGFSWRYQDSESGADWRPRALSIYLATVLTNQFQLGQLYMRNVYLAFRYKHEIVTKYPVPTIGSASDFCCQERRQRTAGRSRLRAYNRVSRIIRSY